MAPNVFVTDPSCYLVKGNRTPDADNHGDALMRTIARVHAQSAGRAT